MTDIEIEKVNNAYEEYCKHDGKKLYHLPFIIWLKQVAKIKPSEYYSDIIPANDYKEEKERIMISENMSLEQMNKQFEDFSINKFVEDVDKRIESYLHTKQYVRFGRFPKDNISKNRRGDEIVKEEKGLSVWNCVMVNGVPFPILPDNPSEDCLADYFYMLLSDRNVYLVTGEELDEKGSAGEPLLVGNIEIIREYTKDYDYLKKIHTRRNRK